METDMSTENRIDQLCDRYMAAGRDNERAVIAEWLLTIEDISLNTRVQIIRGLMNGEHHRILASPLLHAENQFVHDLHVDPVTVMPVQLSPETRAEFGVPDPPDPVSDDQYEAKREGDTADMANEVHVPVPGGIPNEER